MGIFAGGVGFKKRRRKWSRMGRVIGLVYVLYGNCCRKLIQRYSM
jgi:hypothetical protein